MRCNSVFVFKKVPLTTSLSTVLVGDRVWMEFKFECMLAAKWGGGEGEKGVAAPMVAGARFFMFSEIKRITNNFENEIGVGGYGKVPH